MKLRAFLKIMAYDCPSMILALILTAVTVMASDPILQVVHAILTIYLWLLTIWIAYAEGVRRRWDVE